MTPQMSITAWLKAKDSMSGVFKKVMGNSERLGSALKRMTIQGAGMQIGMSAVQKGMQLMSESMDGAIKRFDTLNNYEGVMNNLGLNGAKAFDVLNGRVASALGGLPTSLDSAASSITRFATKTKDIDKSADYFLAVNNALIAGGQSMAIQETALEQLSQAFAKGKPDATEWKSLMSAMPGQLDQVAQAMGMTADELGEGLTHGTVKMKDFMDTIVQLNKEGVNGLKNFEDQAHDAVGGIGMSITGFKTAVTRGITGMLTAIDANIAKAGLPFDSIGEGIGMASKAVDKGFERINAAVGKANIKGFIAGITPAFNTLANAAKAGAPYVQKVFTIINNHAEQIGKAVPIVLTLGTAFHGLMVVSAVSGPISKFAQATLAMAKNGALKLLPARLLGVGKGARQAGQGAVVAATNMIKLGAGVLMIGAGIALAAVGLALLAQSAIALAGSGGAAIAVMFGMIGALVALGAGVAIAGPALAAGATGALLFGAALLLIATSVVVAGAGLMLMASALPTLAATAGIAAAGMLKLAAAIIGMAATSGALMAIGASALVASIGLGKTANAVTKMASGARASASSLMAIKLALATIGAGAGKQAAAGMAQVNSVLSKGAAKARPLGANLSKGFAAGMRSALGSIKSAADAIVRQAERVIKAKAKIKSPSRLTKKLGNYFGEGFAIGIEQMAKAVGKSSAALIDIPRVAMAGMPDVSMPSIGMSYNASLSDDYVYGNGNQTIEVPLYINSREFAKATSADIANEQASRTKRENRKLGRL